MFIVVSVCPPGVGCSYMTTTHDALARARTAQGLPLCPKWSNLFNLDITVADPAGGLGGKKHEIYAAAFDGNLFNDLFLQPPPSLDPPLPHFAGHPSLDMFKLVHWEVWTVGNLLECFLVTFFIP